MIAQRDVLALQELVRTGGLAPEVEAAVTAAVERIVAQEAWRLSISTAEKELINKVLSGQVPRSAFMRLKEPIRRIAIDYFRSVAEAPASKDAAARAAARILNTQRVQYLQGTRNVPPQTFDEILRGITK